MSWTVRRPHPGRTAVYRLHGFGGRLLYVGISNRPDLRFAQHAADKPWWNDVHDRATTIDWYPTRDQALRVEEYAIKTEGPMYNKVHNPAWGGTYVGERPTDRVARPVAASAVCFTIALGSVVGWWHVATGPQVALVFIGMLAARLAWLRS